MNSSSDMGRGELIRLEEMTLRHLNEVMDIELLAYPFPWSRSMFQSSIASKDECFVLFLEDNLIGYSILNYILDETHLLNICIHPNYEGMGYGRKLLRCLIGKALKRKSSMFFLEVRESNLRAINLYFSEGFNEVGVRRNYYPSKQGREDAVLMTLDLTIDAHV